MFVATAAIGASATRTFLQREATINIGATSTFTWTDCNIGTAAADRYVVAVIGAGVVGVSGRTLSGVTIGGSAADIRATATSDEAASATRILTIAQRLVTSGTTATIVATFSNTMQVGFCFVYTITGLIAAAPTATATETENALVDATISDTINIPAGGVLIGGVVATGTTGTWSFSGVTEDADNNTNNIAAGSASEHNLSAETARAYSATVSANTPGKAMAFAAWN